jgi:hypothetical protein
VKAGSPFQQIDILPTALDLLNQKTSYFAMGTSYFKNKSYPKLAYSSENFIAFENGKVPFYWNEQQKNNRSRDEISKIRNLKAIYQQYTSALIQNKMKP